jgi:hypothetical protein
MNSSGRGKVLESIAPTKLTSLRQIAQALIEGANLSNREAERLLSGVKAKSFARDEQKVAGYTDAMDMVFESFESIPITENHIKQLHGVLATLFQTSCRDVSL